MRLSCQSADTQTSDDRLQASSQIPPRRWVINVHWVYVTYTTDSVLTAYNLERISRSREGGEREKGDGRREGERVRERKREEREGSGRGERGGDGGRESV